MKEKKIRIRCAAMVGALWLGLAVFAWLGPRQDISEAERRKLAAFPKISVESILNGSFMSGFETYSQDQFPLRDRFRQVKALFSYDILRKGDNNGIYLAEGYAAKLEYPLSESSASGAVRKFEKIYDRYLKDHCGKIVFSVVPDKSYYLARKNGYPAMDYDRLFSVMQSLEWAEYVDITDQLAADCYYTTDTHWRQEKILGAAEKLAAALGSKMESEYRTETLMRPFYGVYYGQAALPMEPETISILRSDVLDACTVTNYENQKVTAVYDMDKLESRDLYDVFLSGAVSVLEIENPLAESDRELIVFRDSFGSSLVPLLVRDYAKVTLLDIRYVPTDYLGNFVTFDGQDVLFLYSPLVLNNSTMLK